MSIKKRLAGMLSAFVALVAVFAIATPAFAATINITGNNGETYTAYKVLDVTTATDGEGKVTGYNYTTASEDVADVLKDSGATVTQSPAGNLWYVTVPEGTNFTLASTLAALPETSEDPEATTLQSLFGNGRSITLDSEAESATVNGNTGKVTDSITGLGAGYYFVTSTTGSMCMLNTAADTANIEDKNAEPTVDKKVDGASTSDAQIGDTVTYTVTVNVPADTETLTLNDTLSNGLTMNTGSFQIAIDNGEATSLNAPSTTTGEDGSTSFSIELTGYLE